MKERPILFSAPMVRALLAGTKTQTRRVVKPQPPATGGNGGVLQGIVPSLLVTNRGQMFDVRYALDNPMAISCPYGAPGDRLWARETFMDLQGTGVEHRPDPRGQLHPYAYQADTPPGSRGDEARKEYGLKWKPCIHMPRAASRITLEVTSVRVERLQDISEADALAEGIQRYTGSLRWVRYLDAITGEACHNTAAEAFKALWIGINGQESWDANHWTWVIEFKCAAQEGGTA